MTARHTSPRGDQAGITLIELLITMVILTVVTTMLVGGWISLQRAYAFASAKNNATAQARDAIDRISSEVRAAQGLTYNPTASPSPTTSTPFVVGGTIPYVCDANDITFYSAYNNASASLQSGKYGRGQLRLTSIWLDTSGAKPQKTLYWQRDTNSSGTLDSGDRKIKLASNVVNTAAAINRPIFTYNVLNSAGIIIQTASLTSANVAASTTSANVASLVSVQINVIADANIAHTPTYVDLMTTVEPRNLSSHQ
ncbi:MAG: type II secretion system protein [Armatimonadota bacterium]